MRRKKIRNSVIEEHINALLGALNTTIYAIGEQLQYEGKDPTTDLSDNQRISIDDRKLDLQMYLIQLRKKKIEADIEFTDYPCRLKGLYRIYSK